MPSGMPAAVAAQAAAICARVQGLDARLADMLVSALGAAGTEAAQDVLAAMRQDPNSTPALRTSATVALFQVARPGARMLGELVGGIDAAAELSGDQAMAVLLLGALAPRAGAIHRACLRPCNQWAIAPAPRGAWGAMDFEGCVKWQTAAAPVVRCRRRLALARWRGLLLLRLGPHLGLLRLDRQGGHLERDLAIHDLRLDVVWQVELALQDLLGERILKVLLDAAL